jgi:tetratricopeptide (TPR) repeat protein
LRAGFAEFAEMQKIGGPASSYFNSFDPLAFALWQCRRRTEAVRRADRLIATDPLNPNPYLTKAAIIGQSGEPAEAEQLVRQAIALSPELTWPRAFQAYFLMLMGKLDEAETEFSNIEGVGPWSAMAAVTALKKGKPAEADRIVAEMRAAMGDAAYYQFAQVDAQRGRKEEAIAALEKGWATRDPGLTFLQVDPLFAPLRGHPRFQQLVRRLDFPS